MQASRENEAIEYGEQLVERLRASGLDETADELQGDVDTIRAGGFDGLAVRYGLQPANAVTAD